MNWNSPHNTNRPILRRRGAVVLAAALLVAACGGSDSPPTAGPAESAAGTAESAAGTGTVTVYTGRHYGIEPVFEAFTAKTGIEVRFTTGNDPELRERLVAEGANTPADVLMTADASNAELASGAGVLASLTSATLDAAVPAELRTDDWVALSRRARVIIASTERVPTPPTTYAGVGDAEWRGRICLRPSTHPYTQSLVASLIIAEGEQRATEIVQSWVDNDPLYINSDTDIYKAVASGECDIAIANTYYLGRLLTEDPAFPVRVVWPEQDGRGAHVNVSTAAITKHAQNPTAALALVEWLATDGQKAFADANFEYPADPKVAPAEVVASWGTFVADLAAITKLGSFQPAAVDILSITGYE